MKHTYVHTDIFFCPQESIVKAVWDGSYPLLGPTQGKEPMIASSGYSGEGLFSNYFHMLQKCFKENVKMFGVITLMCHLHLDTVVEGASQAQDWS